jgi:TfoX/Sxy family transcriptional regulator of competence genes
MTQGNLAINIRAHLSSAGTVREVKMFGGIGFMLNGNLVAAVSKRGLLLRVGKERYVEGRALKTWLDGASHFVKTLQPKAKKTTQKGKET